MKILISLLSCAAFGLATPVFAEEGQESTGGSDIQDVDYVAAELTASGSSEQPRDLTSEQRDILFDKVDELQDQISDMQDQLDYLSDLLTQGHVTIKAVAPAPDDAPSADDRTTDEDQDTVASNLEAE